MPEEIQPVPVDQEPLLLTDTSRPIFFSSVSK